MTVNRAFVFSLMSLALALSCSASGAREDSAAASASARAAARTNFREGLASVDFTGLSDAQKDRALDLLNSHDCDCSCGMTIAQCRVEDKTCGRSPQLARKVIDAVRAGQTDAQVASALKEQGAAPAQAAPAAQPTARPDPATPVQISLEGLPRKGNSKGKATLVEYADFQCPYCVRAVPVVNQLLQKYPEDLSFVFKHLPLTSIHTFAEPASRAAVAADRQGKFWEMYEKLFANARALDDASLRKYAGEVGLDLARFDNDFRDPAVAAAVRKDAEEAQRLGVNGTPTFFLNGVRVPSWDEGTLSLMIETARSGGDVAAVAAEILQKLQEQQMAARRAQQERMAALATQVHQIDLSGAPVKGDPKAPVTIVEFGDFQCPYCANSQPLIKQVMDAFPGKIRLAFKHLPLTSIHPNAKPAAIVAVEAMQHGKFWEAKELLYQNYNRLDKATLLSIASQVGLDSAEVQKALETNEHASLVDKDVADSQRYGVTGTPTFFVNGKRVMQRDFSTFKRMIEEALGMPASGSAG